MPINMTFSLLLIWLLADYISYEIGVQEWEYFKDKPAKDYWDYKLL